MVPGGRVSATKPTVADTPAVPPCDRCGGVELVRKMHAVICADCRIVRIQR